MHNRNAEPTTVAGDQVTGTTVDKRAATEPIVPTTGRPLTTTDNHRSTFDEEDHREVMIMQSSRPAALTRPTTRTGRTKSHFNARSNLSFYQNIPLYG